LKTVNFYNGKTTTEGQMFNIIKIAGRNLRRYQRRTILTTALIALGVIAVLLFISITGSFKNMMVGQFTDSMLGHIQIHRRGYLASIESLPLDRNMNQRQVAKIKKILNGMGAVESYSMRIKLGAMFSNFTQTTNIRLNAVIPEQEVKTVPLLSDRIVQGDTKNILLRKGEILVPELIAKGMKVKVGDTIVLVANNKKGSVNGKTFLVSGVLEGISGPGGRDGVIHLDDAKELLRIDGVEIAEIAIRLKRMEDLAQIFSRLKTELSAVKDKQGKPAFEVHTWEKLTPFYNIVKMIDLMTFFINIMLIAIVLVSIMNVMIMAVYERINEIGTISAIGTLPGKIMTLFVTEGFLIGVLGTVVGIVISLISIVAMNVIKITFNFGQQSNLVLAPTIQTTDIITIGVIVIGIAVLASLQPAFKAARMDPITALRHV
jgi:putative ABC transport system permease protein